MTHKSDTQKAFSHAINSLTLMAVIVLLSVVMHFTQLEIISLLIGILVFIIGALSIIGLIHSLKGIKSENNLKKVVGLIINVTFVFLFIYVFIANALDIVKVMN